MRIHRIAALGVASLLLAAPAMARVLGAGPSKTDCYASFEGVTATSKGKIVDCTDGDPACDFDTDRGTCTFHFTICAYITDSGLSDCHLSPITKITPKKLKLPPLPASNFVCGDDNVVKLKLKKRGGSNKKLINMVAFATDKPKRDPDKLVLRCNPAPASPSGAFVWE